MVAGIFSGFRSKLGMELENEINQDRISNKGIRATCKVIFFYKKR